MGINRQFVQLSLRFRFILCHAKREVLQLKSLAIRFNNLLNFLDMAKNSSMQKYRIFVEEYQKDFNGTRAAIAAGYSEKTAYSKANQLLKTNEVKELLNAATALVIEEKKDEREKLREMLANAAYLDLTELVVMGKTGCTLKEFKEIPKWQRILITKIANVSGKTGWKINFEVFSKEKAVEILTRVFGMDKGNNGGVTINNFGTMAAIVDSYPE